MKTAIDIWLTFVSVLIGLLGFFGMGGLAMQDVQMPPLAATVVFVNYLILIATSVGLVRRIWKLDEPRKSDDLYEDVAERVRKRLKEDDTR